jgi:hypothetical protein
MHGSKKHIGKYLRSSLAPIDKVDAIESFHQSTGDKWLPVLKNLNPFGAIADAYVKTLTYKLETKRLDMELERIKAQAGIAHHAIDQTLSLKIAELAERRMALMSFYQTVNAELEHLHIERKMVLDMAKAAHEKALQPELPLQERQLYKDLCIAMTRELPNFGDKANESLQKLVQALPPVAISPKLLEG